MNMRFLVATAYDGRTYGPDDVLSVDGETAERWMRNGIAEPEADPVEEATRLAAEAAAKKAAEEAAAKQKPPDKKE